MKHTEEQFETYRSFWSFIEAYLPNYSRRDDVLWADILLRFLTDEDVGKDDLERIECEFQSDKSQVKTELVKLEAQFAKEALEEFYKRI